ncbi:MAG: nitrophenyl compound nitroreductase subunit ArsF family protein [Bacteroides sp.]|nr:nitrophenyl compound nitroreductase subunit ArsF family protein [Bacteroides sp.]MCM1448081.1 nitrophenyl compound nitroreductase subunit ArsF family protein [Bacteroides sp.]
MKRILSIVLVCLFVIVGMAQAETKSDGVEVIYFHGKQRCATCMAIEKYAREVVDADFAALKKVGKVRFRVVDISTDKGAKLAKAYKVSWSSLYVNKWKGGKETRNDMTRFGFGYARNKTDEFKKGLKEKINELLK